MRRNLAALASALAGIAVVLVASQTQLFRGGGDSVAPPSSAEQMAVAVAPDPALQAEIDRLTATLADREAAYDRLAATLSGRDAEVTRLTALLAARDTELAALRDQLDALRRQSEFDAALMALKTGGATSVTRLETARFDAADLAALGVAAPEAADSPESVDALVGTLLDQGKTPTDARDAGERRLSSIHFDPSSSRLSPGGRAHAAAAAVTLEDMPVARILVIGHTDRVGNPERNRVLAVARARAVADFLVAAGLPDGMIEVVGMGEAEIPVATDDGVAEPLNRCAEIVVTPI